MLYGADLEVRQLDIFKKEISKFPASVKEDLFDLVERYVKKERLNTSQFKTFKIDKKTKVQEFKVKDHKGNWRAISCMVQKGVLVFVYAFHKKTQVLLQKDKDIIIKRIRMINI